MTTDELIHELRELVNAHRYQVALDLTSRVLPAIRPSITSEQVVRIAEMMHVAQMAVDLEEWDTANAQTQTPVEGSRRS